LVAGACLGPSTALASGVWSAPTNIDRGEYFTSLSCPSATFCAAVGGSEVLTYNGTSWSAPTNIDDGGYIGHWVSCSSATFCVAISYDGPGVSYARTYNGKSWTAPTNIGGFGGGTGTID
jgi:hypothetical protein